MTATFAQRTLEGTGRIAVGRQEAAILTAALAALLVWLPLQTPIAIAAYQYGGLPVGSVRAILLFKDAAVGLLILALVVRHGRRFRWHWADIFAGAYVGLLVIYAVVPQALGYGLPLPTVAAALREFLVPVELYVLGRFAVQAGAVKHVLVGVFIAGAGLAAIFTVGQFVALPVEFWGSTLDLVSFVREVQGRPAAYSLADISLVGTYGIPGSPTIARAVGPFTHPVGTAYYFVVPLLLAISATLAAFTSEDRRRGIAMLLAVGLFGAAVITTLSRGAWMAVIVGTLICGAFFHRKLAAVVAIGAVMLFLVVTPPFSYSISSALTLQDPSTIGHQQEIERGIETVQDNPWGLGLGHGDAVFGATFVGEEELTRQGVTGPVVGENIGENMYLAILASMGPLGLIALVGWLAGVGSGLWPDRPTARDWARIGLLATLAGLAVSSMTASPFMRFTTAASFWLLVGLYVSDAGSSPAALRSLMIARVQGLKTRATAALERRRQRS